MRIYNDFKIKKQKHNTNNYCTTKYYKEDWIQRSKVVTYKYNMSNSLPSSPVRTFQDYKIYADEDNNYTNGTLTIGDSSLMNNGNNNNNNGNRPIVHTMTSLSLGLSAMGAKNKRNSNNNDNNSNNKTNNNNNNNNTIILEIIIKICIVIHHVELNLLINPIH